MGTPHRGLFPLENAICQPQQAEAIPRQSEHNKCLSLLLTKLKFVIFRRSARTNECLRLIAPSLLTDILLISKSSVIFGLSITLGSSEVKFWGCNQCLSQAGWSCTKVMAKHCWRGRKPRLLQVSVILFILPANSQMLHQEQEVSPVPHQASANSSKTKGQ